MTSVISLIKSIIFKTPSDGFSVKNAPKSPQESLNAIWKNHLQNNTEKIEGIDPEDAQIICLGDIHTEKWQRQWRGEVIDHYSSGKDIVLCEGAGPLTKVVQSTAPFLSKKKFECFGWDDMDLWEKSREAIFAIAQLKEKYREEQPSPQWSNTDKIAWKNYLKTDEDCFDKRSLKMIETAKTYAKNLSPGQRIFIIAGSDHLDPAQFNAIKALIGFKVSVLLPKDLSSNPSEDERLYIESSTKKMKTSKSKFGSNACYL